MGRWDRRGEWVDEIKVEGVGRWNSAQGQIAKLMHTAHVNVCRYSHVCVCWCAWEWGGDICLSMFCVRNEIEMVSICTWIYVHRYEETVSKLPCS